MVRDILFISMMFVLVYEKVRMKETRQGQARTGRPAETGNRITSPIAEEEYATVEDEYDENAIPSQQDEYYIRYNDINTTDSISENEYTKLNNMDQPNLYHNHHRRF